NMTTPAMPDGYRRSEPVWDYMGLGFARRVASLAGFCLFYSGLVLIGLLLRESSEQLTIIWPAAGLLFMALWFAPRRNWIWILGVQVAGESAIDFARSLNFIWLHYGPFILANSIDGMVGA